MEYLDDFLVFIALREHFQGRSVDAIVWFALASMLLAALLW